MIDSSIEYKSIILRCDQIDESAYLELDSDVEIEFYKKGMETVWTGVQKGAGEFERIIDSDVTTYFIERYGCEQDELEKRCIFLKKRVQRNTLELVWHGLNIREKKKSRFYIGLP